MNRQSAVGSRQMAEGGKPKAERPSVSGNPHPALRSLPTANRRLPTGERGFSLVELLIAMTILSIIAGVAYSSFGHVLRVYQGDAQRLALAQASRLGLEQIVRDLSNMTVAQGDTNLTFYAEDIPGETESDALDFVTFVTTVTPDINATPPLSREAPSVRLSNDTSAITDEDETEEVPTDIVRVLYVIAPNPDAETPLLKDDGTPFYSLLRVTTPTLNIEEAVGDALSSGDLGTILAALQENGAEFEVLIDQARSLNFEFWDSENEEWISTWDNESGGTPRAMRVFITVEDGSETGTTYTRSSAASIPLSIDGAAAGGQQTQQQQPGGQQPQQQGQQPAQPQNPTGTPQGGGQ